MIVVDTNIVAYALIQGEKTQLAHLAIRKDAQWRLPPLWRYEMLNVLAVYVQHRGCSLAQALELWEEAVRRFESCERNISLSQALQIAAKYRMSAYDAQFIALALSLGVRCLTEDRLLLNTFPGVAVSLREFCQAQE